MVWSTRLIHSHTLCLVFLDSSRSSFAAVYDQGTRADLTQTQLNTDALSASSLERYEDCRNILAKLLQGPGCI